jgi:hypothetical protein
MSTKQRPADAGAARGRSMLTRALAELTVARRDRGLGVLDIGRAIDLSGSAVSRLLGGQTQDVGVIRLSTIAAVAGLDLSVRTYPGGTPIRDAARGALLRAFRSRLHSSLTWGIEVPLPRSGDQRAWDGFIRGRGWRYGVEAETHPTDVQALGRRLELKRLDGEVDGIILVLPATRHTRAFLRLAGDFLRPIFPVPGSRALELLGAGVDPGGCAIVVI